MSQKTAFISYRRDPTGKAFARSVKEALTQKGYDVFLDVDSLTAGRWAEQIKTQIAEKSHFILILSPDALHRCSHEDDWVRKECLAAKASGRNIVPIREDSVNLGDMKQSCPEDLRWIFDQQVAELKHGSFEADIERLLADFIPPHKAPAPFREETTKTTLSIPRFLPRRAEPFVGHKAHLPQVLSLWEQRRCLAITGIGGLGKTGLAAEILASLPGRLFSHDYYQQPEHLAALSTLVSQTGTDPAGMSQEKMELLVQSELGQPNTRLYLEGCEQAKDVQSLLHLTGDTHVLLTTRDETTPDGVHGWPLPPLALDDAADLISHLSGRPQAQVTALASYLGGHALATRLAGNLLKNRLRTVSQLLANLQSDGLSALGTEEKQHRSVFFLLKEIATHLEEAHPGTAKVWYTLALGAVSPLPLSLLRSMVNAPDEMLQAMQHEGILLAREVPPESGDEPEPAVQLSHSLVQAFAGDYLGSDREDYVAWREGWFRYLDYSRSIGNIPGGWRRYEMLVPQLNAIVPQLWRYETEASTDLARTIDRLAKVHCDAGNLLVAATLYQITTKLNLNHRGIDAESSLVSQSCLASVLSQLGDHERAEPILREVYEAQQRILGPDHHKTLMTLNNYAIALAKLAHFSEAEIIHRRLMAIRERDLGEEHSETLVTINNLASVLAQQGKLDSSEDYFRRVATTRERVHGPCDPRTLNSRANLGALHLVTEHWMAARDCLAKVIADAESIFSPEHPNRMQWQRNLAAAEAKIRELGLE